MLANVFYLGVCVFYIAHGSLNLFRFRNEVSYYDNGEFKNEWNWFRITDKIRLWGELSVYGVLGISQAIAMFGLLVNINF